MSTDIEVIGAQKVKSIANGETVELKTLWTDQNVVIVFFRRWGCMLCRLWAKELSEIAPVLTKNGIKLIGVGVEEAGSKEFVDGKFFDGDLYYVENQSTYSTLGYKRFNVFTILASLLWKQSRDALSKAKRMGLGGDYKGDWGQTGGALLVRKGGNVLRHFVQSGPGDHLPNMEILKLYGLESEYNPATMENKKVDEAECALGVLAVVCVFGRMSAAQARPCGSGDYDSCLMYKTAFYDQDATVDAQETYGVRERTGADRNRRQHRLPDLETGEPIADTQAIIANGTVIDEDADVVDREDHFTQHLADLFVNTDSEITSLQANDFEEPREYSGGSHDAYFALLSGMEMALVMPETCAFSIGGLLRDGV